MRYEIKWNFELITILETFFRRCKCRKTLNLMKVSSKEIRNSKKLSLSLMNLIINETNNFWIWKNWKCKKNNLIETKSKDIKSEDCKIKYDNHCWNTLDDSECKKIRIYDIDFIKIFWINFLRLWEFEKNEILKSWYSSHNFLQIVICKLWLIRDSKFDKNSSMLMRIAELSHKTKEICKKKKN